MFATPAFAQTAADGGMAAALSGIAPLLLMLPIFYFLLIRPQQQKAKQHKAMIDALRRGDQVLTQGGILARVTKVLDDGYVEVEIADGVKVKLLKSMVMQVISKTEPAAAA